MSVHSSQFTVHSSHLTLFLLLCGCLCVACHHSNRTATPQTPAVDYSSVEIPLFVADSAYQFVADQVYFGPRTPGSEAHRRCAKYLCDKMAQWCDTVIVQPFNARLWDGSSVEGKNIIASFNPTKSKRVLLAAHWDSRLWADHDPDPAYHHSPILGANDGASGVAVLMEMARVMSQQRPDVGVDFVFFDVEDQGTPSWGDSYEDDTWCKGSQYWSATPHVPFYQAVYGVLFDMVGTANPRFTKEQFSMTYASSITNKLWNAAAALGLENVFVNQKTDPILDDHIYVNRIAAIPMVDIVQNSPQGNFFPYWHTMRDDLAAIDAPTMAMVANVTMKVIYSDFATK